MTLNFNIKSLNNAADSNSIIVFEIKNLNKKPEMPSEAFRLKDSSGNYLFDSDNKAIFVRR